MEEDQNKLTKFQEVVETIKDVVLRVILELLKDKKAGSL